MQSSRMLLRGGWTMGAVAMVLAACPVSVPAQTDGVKTDLSRPLTMATASTVTVSQAVLQGLADSEPDISARDEAPQPGMVLLRVLVSKTGAVEEAVALSGAGELPRVAVAGVMGWSYRPYLVNGEPREFQSTISLSFHDGVGKRAPSLVVMGMPGGGVAGNIGPVTAPARMPDGAIRVSSGVAASMLLERPSPVYPPIAKAAHVQGVVVMHAIISKDGDIEDLQVVSGPPMLVGAAKDAVQQWKYRPYLLNGKPVEVVTTINVNFQFTEAPKPADPTSDSGTN